MLQSLALTLPGGALAYGGSAAQVSGKLTITSIDVSRGGRWRPAVSSGGLDAPATWRAETAGESAQSNASSVTAGSKGLTWTIAGVPSVHDPTLGVADVPAPLPAIVAGSLATPSQPLFTGNSLDGSPVQLQRIASLPWIPGAPADGVIVDRKYAELAAGGNLTVANQQVWLAAGALPVIRPKLMASGVRILADNSIAASAAQFERQGPALASALFLCDAGAAVADRRRADC